MLNVEQITSSLAKLPDNALQQYAMLHKNDPYTLSLALSESNRRKQLRASAQAQGQGQPQPKVVDQAVAGMLPENVGIGALPAQNMQQFADGGIVGYADGGYNPASGPAGRLAYDNEPVLRMADGGMVAFAEGGETELPEWVKRLPEDALIRKLYEKKPGRGLFEPAPMTYAKQVPPVNQDMENARDALLAQGRDMTPQTPAPAGIIPNALPNMRAAPAPANAAAAAAPRKPVVGAADPVIEQLQSVRKALGIDDQAEFNREKAMAEREKYLGDNPAKAQMERLDKLEQMAQSEREDAKNFSILRAGLSMMASRSPYAMVGIGEGAQAGLGSYESALKELKAAERDREKMRQNAENAVYAARAGNYDHVDTQYNKWLDRKEKNDERLLSVYGTLKSAEMQGQTARDVARINAAPANRSPAEIQLIERVAKERGISFMDAYNEVIAAKREPMTIEKLRADWLDMGKRMQIQQDYPNVKTFEDYVTVMQPGAGGNVGGDKNKLKLVGTRPGP